MRSHVSVRAIRPSDATWIRGLIRRRWGAEVVVTRGRVHKATELPGFIAEASARRIGLVTHLISGTKCEIVTLDSLVQGRGVGSALIDRVVRAAHSAGCSTVWLITTNDNLRALRFYQRRGFRLKAVHRGAVDRARSKKPQISLVGNHGIEIHDELELELLVESHEMAGKCCTPSGPSQISAISCSGRAAENAVRA